MDSNANSQSSPSTQSEAVRGKPTFQAIVTGNVGNHYTIETVIDGKPLRGVLFSNKPSTLPIPSSGSRSRKRTRGNLSTSIRQESVEDGHADEMHGKEASSQEPYAEPAGPVAVSNVPQPSDGSSDMDKMRGHDAACINHQFAPRRSARIQNRRIAHR